MRPVGSLAILSAVAILAVPSLALSSIAPQKEDHVALLFGAEKAPTGPSEDYKNSVAGMCEAVSRSVVEDMAAGHSEEEVLDFYLERLFGNGMDPLVKLAPALAIERTVKASYRSEERRVGKECRL